MEPRERLVVVGKTGSGKSRHVKALCAQLVEKGHRVLVFDVCDEYSTAEAGCEADFPGPLPQRLEWKRFELRVEETLGDPELACAVVPEGKPEEVAEQFDALAEFVKNAGDMVLVVEECGYFSREADQTLKEVATLYRKHGVPLIIVAQRAVQVPLTARSQASEVHAFLQDEPADLEALQQRCGRLVPDIAERVSRLPPGDYVTWRDDLSPKKETSK